MIVQPVKQIPKSSKFYPSGCFLFPNIEAKADIAKKPRKRVVSLAEPLDFPTKMSKVALTAHPTYKLQISDVLSTTVTHIAQCPFGTGAKVDLLHPSMTPIEWRNGIIRNMLLTLWTPTKK